MRALLAVATHGSVAAAAEVLHVTPSGVSQQLGKLEREAGQPLLEPHGRGVRLTPAGKVLAEHAEVVFAQLAAARSDLDGLRQDIMGPVRIGAISTSLHALLPPALARLAAKHPRVSVRLTEGEAEWMVPAVAAGDVDLAVIESWENYPAPIVASTSREPLLTETTDLALPATHRLAHRKTVNLSEVDDLPWIAWTEGSRCHHWLEQTLRAEGLDPEVTCTVGGYSTQLALVAGNVGAALVPKLIHTRPGSIPDEVRIVTTKPVVHRTIYAVWRTGADTPAVRAGVEALKAVSEQVAGGLVAADGNAFRP
ncbi:HTH-type transcriptional regulator GltC [Amycolatopsis sp. CA-230715]|nr:HTH-type transcriptional regulator GltC [Amycolatopsis sp. CA-230715]